MFRVIIVIGDKIYILGVAKVFRIWGCVKAGWDVIYIRL